MTFALTAMLTGCITLRVDAVPPAVRQDIGVNHLKDATARWRCEGGEELGVIPEGLFVASQDFILPKRKDVEDSPYDAYTYNRPGDWDGYDDDHRIEIRFCPGLRRPLLAKQ